MNLTEVPEALAERLGNDGTEGLVTLLGLMKTEWTHDVLATAVDRFDRRLGTEVSSLRADLAREMATLRQDVTRDILVLRQDVTKEMSVLRQDVTKEMAMLRQDFTRDLSNVRVELLKWSFLFWIGQVAAIAGLLAFMLQA